MTVSDGVAADTYAAGKGHLFQKLYTLRGRAESPENGRYRPAISRFGRMSRSQRMACSTTTHQYQAVSQTPADSSSIAGSSIAAHLFARQWSRRLSYVAGSRRINSRKSIRDWMLG